MGVGIPVRYPERRSMLTLDRDEDRNLVAAGSLVRGKPTSQVL